MTKTAIVVQVWPPRVNIIRLRNPVRSATVWRGWASATRAATGRLDLVVIVSRRRVRMALLRRHAARHPGTAEKVAQMLEDGLV